jgi:transcriptional regulator with XRE-family HTH domain
MRRAVLLGSELRRLRLEKGLTLEQIGRFVFRRGRRLSRGYLCGIENAKVGPPTDILLRKLAAVLEVPFERLLLLAHLDKLPAELFNAYPVLRALRDETARAAGMKPSTHASSRGRSAGEPPRLKAVLPGEDG